jgi:hypothetical protein
MGFRLRMDEMDGAFNTLVLMSMGVMNAEILLSFQTSTQMRRSAAYIPLRYTRVRSTEAQKIAVKIRGRGRNTSECRRVDEVDVHSEQHA